VGALEQLLTKAPDLLEKYHQCIVALPGDELELANKKSR